MTSGGRPPGPPAGSLRGAHQTPDHSYCPDVQHIFVHFYLLVDLYAVGSHPGFLSIFTDSIFYRCFTYLYLQIPVGTRTLFLFHIFRLLILVFYVPLHFYILYLLFSRRCICFLRIFTSLPTSTPLKIVLFPLLIR